MNMEPLPAAKELWDLSLAGADRWCPAKATPPATPEPSREERHARRYPKVPRLSTTSLPSPRAPTLLPGESIERYQLMRRALIADIAPNSAIEWLLAFDVIELSWEIERYRLLRHKILMQYREQAIEQCLCRIDLLEFRPSPKDSAASKSAATPGAGASMRRGTRNRKKASLARGGSVHTQC